LSYLEAENEYCEQYRRTHLAALQRSLVREMNSHTEPEAFSVPERVGDLWYYLRYPSRSNHPVYCRATVLTRYLVTLRVLPRQCARARDADVARDASPAATRPPPPRPRSMLRCGGCTVCRQRVRARTTPPTPTASRSPRPCSSIKRPRAPTLATLPSTSSMCRRVRATSDSREYVCVSLFDPRGAISRIRSLERAC